MQNTTAGKIAYLIRHFSNVMLDEMKLPDFKSRHFFTARLRIFIFLSCWGMFFLFYSGVWTQAPIAPLLFNIGFMVTAICYWNVLREKHVLSMMFLEILADTASQTTIIYLLGYQSWAPFFIYCLYVISTGSLFGYISALIAATFTLVCYSILTLLIVSGLIEPFVYPKTFIGVLDWGSFKPYFNITFLPLALALIVYTVKIGNYFSKIKQRALERRNLQLEALNQIGSTIRRALQLDKVIDQVLKGVVQGLGFEICILALASEDGKRITFHVPEFSNTIAKMEDILGVPFSQIYLPTDVRDNSALKAILKNRVIIRNDFLELVRGMQPAQVVEKAQQVQHSLGFKKFVITPLIAEHRVIGALIGATRKPYVEETFVDTLDNFANQAALAIETAQLFDKLNLKNRELLEANRVKSEFLAVMSHELRTPLIAVIGYTEVLLDRMLGDLNAEQEKSLREVLRNGHNLLELINNILDLAKLESGKMELSLVSFDLQGLIEEIHSTLLPLIRDKKQHFSIESSSSLPHIIADPLRLRQILINLIGNAIKFTGEGGRINIFLDYALEARSLLDFFPSLPESSLHEPCFLIRVQDSGIGMKKEDLPAIFEIFQQIDNPYTRKHQGTGMGLALTRELVQMHQGQIHVKSEIGKGSEFLIFLPQHSGLKDQLAVDHKNKDMIV